MMTDHIPEEWLAQYSQWRLEEPELGQVEEPLLICKRRCDRLTEFDDTRGLNG